LAGASNAFGRAGSDAALVISLVYMIHVPDGLTGEIYRPGVRVPAHQTPVNVAG